MISTKGRYALRVMIDLAQQPEGQFVPLEEIANRQEISKKYLEIILKILIEKKLLKGQRGKGGGYMLTRPPEQYSAGEILELTEGTLAAVACLGKGAEPCARKASCLTLPLWKKYDDLTHEFFYSVTLSDIVNGTI